MASQRAWREPPPLRDKDLEEALLGAVLSDSEIYPTISPLLRADDFGVVGHRPIYRAIETLASGGKDYDEFSVIDWLQKHDLLDEAGGPEAIQPLSTRTPPDYLQSAQSWARAILEYSERRANLALGLAYTQAAHSPLDAAPRAEIVRQQTRLADIERRLCGEADAAGADDLLGVSLADVVPEDFRWLWRGRLALGKLTMVDGDPGLGKSLATLDITARVAMGRAMPDGTPGLDAPACVVIVCGEDGLADTVVPRLLAAGVSPDAMGRIRAIDSVPQQHDDGTVTNRMLSLLADLPKIEATITRMGARLLIVDPVTAYLGNGTDMYKDSELRQVLTPLAQMAERSGVAALGVRHLNKNTSTPALHRGLGGVGFIGVARLGLLFAPNPDSEGEVLVSRHKGNIGSPPPTLAYRIVQMGEAENMPRISWLGERETTAGDALAAQSGAGADGETRSATDEAVEWLRSYLADGPQAAKEVQSAARADGISEKTLRTARLRTCKKPDKEGMRGGWLWELDPAKMPSSEHRASSEEDDSASPDSKPTPTKMPKTESTGHLRGEMPPKMPTNNETGHLRTDAVEFSDGDVPEEVIAPKMPTPADMGTLARSDRVCKATGRSHVYHIQRTADGRRVCTECGQPESSLDRTFNSFSSLVEDEEFHAL